jgi:hypothetical protein
MKKTLNLLALSMFLTTSMPFHVAFSGEEQAQEDAEIIVVPAEAVAMSENMIEQNADINQDKDSPTCIKSGVAFSPRMTKEQRKELFVHGTITDCEGNIWNIKVIPGSDASKQMTIKSWRYAGKKMKHLIQIETYKKATKDGVHFAKKSFNFAKKSSKLLKKGIWDYMIVEAAYNNLLVDNVRVWKNAGVTVANLRGSFGWLFGAIYAGIVKPVTLTGFNILKAAYHVTAGAVIFVGGIAGTAGGVVATVSSPIIVPALEVITSPVLAIGSILTTGTIIPGVVYVWNGTVWVTSQLSHVPDSETVIGGVKFVRLENPKQPQRPQVQITQDDISNVITSSIQTVASQTKQSEIAAKQAEINKQIDELQRQLKQLYLQSNAVKTELNSSFSVIAVNNLFNKQYGSDLIFTNEMIALVSDETKVRSLVLDYAAKMNISLSEAEIQASVAKIIETIKGLSKS